MRVLVKGVCTEYRQEGFNYKVILANYFNKPHVPQFRAAKVYQDLAEADSFLETVLRCLY